MRRIRWPTCAGFDGPLQSGSGGPHRRNMHFRSLATSFNRYSACLCNAAAMDLAASHSATSESRRFCSCCRTETIVSATRRSCRTSSAMLKARTKQSCWICVKCSTSGAKLPQSAVSSAPIYAARSVLRTTRPDFAILGTHRGPRGAKSGTPSPLSPHFSPFLAVFRGYMVKNT